jgi:hypothetical protein
VAAGATKPTHFSTREEIAGLWQIHQVGGFVRQDDFGDGVHRDLAHRHGFVQPGLFLLLNLVVQFLRRCGTLLAASWQEIHLFIE